jgi:nucleoside-diphosphate kinase
LTEKTLGIIKPDAVRRDLVGEVISLAEKAGLKLVALRMLHLSKRQAQGFYQVHKERPFFDSLTDFMSEGPIVVMVLEGDGAIATWRQVMGATDPAQAAEGTIRNLYGQSIERNSVHGSDSPESASFEISYFCSALGQVT